MSRTTRHSAFIATVMSALLLGACASNEERIGQFADVAEAGAAYTASVTSLLDASLTSSIEADNRVLIKARELNKDEAFLKGALDDHEKATREREAVLDQIRQQTTLLEDYFVALSLLASRADDGAAAKATSGLTEATEKLVGELGELSSKIETAQIKDQPVSDLLGSLAPVVIDGYQRQALDRVLEATAEPVSRSLNVHKAALRAIRDQVRDERELMSKWKHSALIIAPYLGDGKLPADWGRNRLEWLTDKGEIRELDQAVAASEKLELAFRKLLRTDIEGPPFKLLIHDLKGLAAFTKRLV